ncbi:RING finger domain-containing protein [Endozoicomonas sp. ALC020]|uniref:RING finger domain-containing protein n=1 Tax=Endozoicomonas sp. ALC020 TaxID=3403077 RepID=UPI003BAEC077
MTIGVVDECLICYRSFDDNEALRCNDKVVLPCHETHVFGRKCIVRWFEQSMTCPVCRSKMPLSFSAPFLRDRVVRIVTNTIVGAAASALTAATLIGSYGIINVGRGLAGTDNVMTALAAGVHTAIVSGAFFGLGNSLADLRPLAFFGGAICFHGVPIAFETYGYITASHVAGFLASSFVGFGCPFMNIDGEFTI